MKKPMNHSRRVKALASKGNKGSNPIALAMILRSAGGRHTDRRKESNRYACRGGRHEYD